MQAQNEGAAVSLRSCDIGFQLVHPSRWWRSNQQPIATGPHRSNQNGEHAGINIHPSLGLLGVVFCWPSCPYNQEPSLLAHILVFNNILDFPFFTTIDQFR